MPRKHGKTKKRILRSEAKILVFLSVAKQEIRYARAMVGKLGMDYPFLLGRLRQMLDKGWIKRDRGRMESKIFYAVSARAPMDLAKKTLSEEV